MLTYRDSDSRVELVKTGKNAYKADLFTDITPITEEERTYYSANMYRTPTAYTFDTPELALAYFTEAFETELVLAMAAEDILTAQQKQTMATLLFQKTDYRYNKAVREKEDGETDLDYLNRKYPGFIEASERWTRILNGETDLDL